MSDSVVRAAERDRDDAFRLYDDHRASNPHPDGVYCWECRSLSAHLRRCETQVALLVVECEARARGFLPGGDGQGELF